MDSKPLIPWHRARALVEAWSAAASVRQELASKCRGEGNIDEALPLENARDAYRRCSRELQDEIDRAER